MSLFHWYHIELLNRVAAWFRLPPNDCNTNEPVAGVVASVVLSEVSTTLMVYVYSVPGKRSVKVTVCW